MNKGSKLTNWLLSNKALTSLRKGVQNSLGKRSLALVSYGESPRPHVFPLINKVKKEVDMLLYYNEAYQIYMCVEQTSKIEGDIAEVGSYRGASGKIICEAKGDKVFHMFDTFEGLPELTKEDDKDLFFKGQFGSSLEMVTNYLKAYKNVHLYKGLFPGTSDPIKDKRFSFVHLDVDLHEPTALSLDFFYPRMNKGGIILSHDYVNAIGVKKAFDEFFADKPEPVIEMSGTQCLIVKT